MSIAEPITIAETISMTISVTISERIQIGDRWGNRVSIVTVAHRWRCISRCISHLRDGGRCGIRDFSDGRCNGDFRSYCDCRSYRDLIEKDTLI